MELKVKYDGLQELIATLKDGQGAKKVIYTFSSRYHSLNCYSYFKILFVIADNIPSFFSFFFLIK